MGAPSTKKISLKQITIKKEKRIVHCDIYFKSLTAFPVHIYTYKVFLHIAECVKKDYFNMFCHEKPLCSVICLKVYHVHTSARNAASDNKPMYDCIVRFFFLIKICFGWIFLIEGVAVSIFDPFRGNVVYVIFRERIVQMFSNF